MLVKFDDIIRNMHNRINKFVMGQAIIRLIEGIILAVLIAVTSFSYNSIKHEITKKDQLIEKINAVTLGVNDEFVNDLFGNAKYVVSYSELDIIEKYYLLDGIVLRTLSNNSAVHAYFVTLTSSEMKNKIDINNYGNLVNEKKLGEFTYQDVKNKPIGVTGFLQNGTGYGIYIEYCYFSSSGNYKSFIFANLPYGLGEFEVIEESDYLSQFEKPDEIKFDLSMTHLKRDNSFPSTFGIYDTEISDEDIIDILTTWHKIDYNSLIIDIENDY